MNGRVKEWVFHVTLTQVLIRKITQKVSLTQCYLTYWTIKKNSRDKIQSCYGCNLTDEDVDGLCIVRSFTSKLSVIAVKKSTLKQAGSVAHVTRINYPIYNLLMPQPCHLTMQE